MFGRKSGFQTEPNGLPLGFFQNSVLSPHVEISQLISVECRICLAQCVQTKLLHPLPLKFNRRFYHCIVSIWLQIILQQNGTVNVECLQESVVIPADVRLISHLLCEKCSKPTNAYSDVCIFIKFLPLY